MEKNVNLDEFVMKEGTEFNEKKFQLISTDEVNENIENAYSNTLIYEDNNVLPGAKVNIPVACDIEMEKEKANEHLIAQAAQNKLKKQVEEFRALSDDEKIKKYIFNIEYIKCTNEFFNKNHYEMSGKQKRCLKRNIETAWKKGKYKFTDAQKQDILFELNKASMQQQVVQQQTNDGTKEAISNLTSLITKA